MKTRIGLSRLKKPIRKNEIISHTGLGGRLIFEVTLVDNILNLNVCLNRNLNTVFHIDNITPTDIYGTNGYYCKVVILGAF